VRSTPTLATLRSQLDPHFLFNTLNSISAYVESAPRQARLMIEQLGDLLRISLDHAAQQEIPRRPQDEAGRPVSRRADAAARRLWRPATAHADGIARDDRRDRL
jgi:Histidine kinase